MMMSPAGMAIAAITVMLWLLWSDSLRAKRPAPVLYAIRIALFLITSGVLILNLVRYPHVFAGTARLLAIGAAVIGIAGAVYFSRRLTRRA
jgi:tellurite resistance protein TehA-like permease